MKSVYSAVRTGSLNKAVCASSLKGLSLVLLSKTLEHQALLSSFSVLFRGTEKARFLFPSYQIIRAEFSKDVR
jgi:hypothetical protein